MLPMLFHVIGVNTTKIEVDIRDVMRNIYTLLEPEIIKDAQMVLKGYGHRR